jgi:putative transposase
MDKSKEPQVYKVKDELWDRLKKHIPVPQGRGRRPEKDKECFEGMIFILRTGCQWKEIPKCYPPRSTVHDRYQKWIKEGIFETLWKESLIEYDDIHGINWEWLSADSASVKSPLGGKKNRA